MKHSIRHSIKSQITIITVAITLFITVLMASVCYYTFQSLLQKSLIQSTQFSLRQAFTSIGTDMELLMNLSTWANTNTKILSYFSGTRTNTGKLEAYNRLDEEYRNNKAGAYISRVIVSDFEHHFIQDARTLIDTSSNDAATVSSLPFFEDLLSARDFQWAGIIQDPHSISAGKQIIPLIRPLYSMYSSKVIGWTYVAVSSSLITDALKDYPLSDDSRLYLTIGEHTYLVDNSTLTEISPSYTIIKEEADFCMVETSDGKRSTIVTVAGIDGWYLSERLSGKEFASQRRAYFTLLLCACLIILALGIVLIAFLQRRINRPIQAISRKLALISHGDFSYDASIEWEHELGDIGRGINRLSRDIVTLMETRIESEKQKKELEYQILQSQINPHFLYNTLNSIKWMATIQNATGIAEVTTALARLLKNISKGNRSMISLREELELLRDYVLIQNYRYGGMIAVSYSIPDERLLDYAIPKLTLQPIVENAIFHGIEAKGMAGQIEVVFEHAEGADDLYIRITDNGVGMSEELIERVLSGSEAEKKTDSFRKVGICNVNMRLKHTFGAEYGISISSREGEYTTMTIRLALRKEEDFHD